MNGEKALTVGRYLRQERERQNISLADVAKVTRITLANLEALEKDEFQSFPAPFFVRGFLRTYASHLGLDPKAILSMFEAQTDTPLPPASKLREATAPPEGVRPLVRYLVILVLVLFAAGVTYFSIRRDQPSPVPVKPPEPVAKMELPPPAFAGKPAEEAKGTEEAAKKQVLKVKALETAWIRVQLDEQPEFDVLLKPGEIVNWTARQQLKMKLGNAGGVEVFLNGTPLGPLGASGQVVHLTLPQDRKMPPAREKTP